MKKWFARPTRQWWLWSGINLGLIAYFGYAFVAPPSSVKASLLPGETTHGHYQIELDCNACHSPTTDSAEHSAGNVMTDACNRCHADQLKRVNDTHPAKKFRDPTNAESLSILDAQDCLTCHREHVPEQTASMGLTLPTDYCWHCHDDVGESRPSHAEMKFDSCATAGCHNYHDNLALYEKFLDDHYGEPDHLITAVVPARDFASQWRGGHTHVGPLGIEDSDGPNRASSDPTILTDWFETAHAVAGINCSGCHESRDAAGANTWNDTVEMSVCETCHKPQTDSFQTGKHGMRLAMGMSPMQPSLARLSMHAGASHQNLNCNACHAGHRFDTQYAAVDACQQCHADSHTLAYANSSHAQLWRAEMAGELPAGSGVSCATCHMPRIAGDDGIWVNHDQNAVLRPSESMAREVCGHCHGIEYALSALADPDLAISCYDAPPRDRIRSLGMAHDYFEARRQKSNR
nr:cytochrome c3 family protein [Rubripirellula tenax]